MKTHAEPVRGIFTTLILLVGLWSLNSCATQQIELARGTHWREAAKVAGQPTTTFSYLMNGRKYDRVNFENMGGFPVVLENGRVFSVVTYVGENEWKRRLSDCMNAGGLPFENGLGPLHSLVVDQGRKFQREGWPREPDQQWTAGQIAMVPLGLAAAPIAGPVIACAFLTGAPAYAATVGSRRKAQDVNTALLDSGTSYSSFLAKLGDPHKQASKGSYCAKSYLATEGFTKLDYPYQVGTKNGRVVWVAYKNSEISDKILEYRKAHGMQ